MGYMSYIFALLHRASIIDGVISNSEIIEDTFNYLQPEMMTYRVRTIFVIFSISTVSRQNYITLF